MDQAAMQWMEMKIQSGIQRMVMHHRQIFQMTVIMELPLIWAGRMISVNLNMFQEKMVQMELLRDINYTTVKLKREHMKRVHLRKFREEAVPGQQMLLRKPQSSLW